MPENVRAHDTGIAHDANGAIVTDTGIKIPTFTSKEKTVSFNSRKAYTKVVNEGEEDESEDHEVTDTWKKIAIYTGVALGFILVVGFGVWWFLANTSGHSKVYVTKKEFVKQETLSVYQDHPPADVSKSNYTSDVQLTNINDKTADNIQLGRNTKSSQSIPSDATGTHDIENARGSVKGGNDTDLVDKELEELEAQVKAQLRRDPDEEDY